jgi:hypothetical protein
VGGVGFQTSIAAVNVDNGYEKIDEKFARQEVNIGIGRDGERRSWGGVEVKLQI